MTSNVGSSWDNFLQQIIQKEVPEHFGLALQLALTDIHLRKQEQCRSVPASNVVLRPEFIYKHEILCAYATFWVFGAYELVRVLEERLNPRQPKGRVQCNFPKAKVLKRHFERIRVPLAKVQKAQKTTLPGDTGWAVVQRAKSGEVEWVLGGVSISRIHLADELRLFRLK